MSTVTISEALNQFLHTASKKLSPGSFKRYERLVELFKIYLELQHVSTPEVPSFCNSTPASVIPKYTHDFFFIYLPQRKVSIDAKYGTPTVMRRLLSWLCGFLKVVQPKEIENLMSLFPRSLHSGGEVENWWEQNISRSNTKKASKTTSISSSLTTSGSPSIPSKSLAPVQEGSSNANHKNESFPFDDEYYQGNSLQLGDDSFYDQVDLTVVDHYTPSFSSIQKSMNSSENTIEEEDSQLHELSKVQNSEDHNSLVLDSSSVKQAELSAIETGTNKKFQSANSPTSHRHEGNFKESRKNTTEQDRLRYTREHPTERDYHGANKQRREPSGLHERNIGKYRKHSEASTEGEYNRINEQRNKSSHPHESIPSNARPYSRKSLETLTKEKPSKDDSSQAHEQRMKSSYRHERGFKDSLKDDIQQHSRRYSRTLDSEYSTTSDIRTNNQRSGSLQRRENKFRDSQWDRSQQNPRKYPENSTRRHSTDEISIHVNGKRSESSHTYESQSKDSRRSDTRQHSREHRETPARRSLTGRNSRRVNSLHQHKSISRNSREGFTEQQSRKSPENSTRERQMESDYHRSNKPTSGSSYRQESKPREGHSQQQPRTYLETSTDERSVSKDSRRVDEQRGRLSYQHSSKRKQYPRESLKASTKRHSSVRDYSDLNPRSESLYRLKDTSRNTKDVTEKPTKYLEPHKHVVETKSKSSDRYRSISRDSRRYDVEHPRYSETSTRIKDKRVSSSHQPSNKSHGDHTEQYIRGKERPRDENHSRSSGEKTGSELERKKRTRSPSVHQLESKPGEYRKESQSKSRSGDVSAQGKDSLTERHVKTAHKESNQRAWNRSASPSKQPDSRDNGIEQEIIVLSEDESKQPKTNRTRRQRHHPMFHDPEYFEGKPLVIERADYEIEDTSNTSSKPYNTTLKGSEPSPLYQKTQQARPYNTEASGKIHQRCQETASHQSPKKQPNPAEIYSLDHLLNLMSEK